ncbi:MAG: hypothetical protein R6W90_06445 [Ignavibacteriaceae bacterium]
MDFYCVDKEPQESGEHEVHKLSCKYHPRPVNTRYLGYLGSYTEAFAIAKKFYPEVTACSYCCNAQIEQLAVQEA